MSAKSLSFDLETSWRVTSHPDHSTAQDLEMAERYIFESFIQNEDLSGIESPEELTELQLVRLGLLHYGLTSILEPIDDGRVTWG